MEMAGLFLKGRIIVEPLEPRCSHNLPLIISATLFGILFLVKVTGGLSPLPYPLSLPFLPGCLTAVPTPVLAFCLLACLHTIPLPPPVPRIPACPVFLASAICLPLLRRCPFTARTTPGALAAAPPRTWGRVLGQEHAMCVHAHTHVEECCLQRKDARLQQGKMCHDEVGKGGSGRTDGQHHAYGKADARGRRAWLWMSRELELRQQARACISRWKRLHGHLVAWKGG
mmetsp:Transcript_34277/g.86011  ORF Transcript_34277/g.86011 Transcript_34277/m.86011 type:complete len:228 (-) Transcript_34277:247-930(-)